MSSDSFNLDIQAFVQHQERDRKPFLMNDPEVDGLVSTPYRCCWWWEGPSSPSGGVRREGRRGGEEGEELGREGDRGGTWTMGREGKDRAGNESD